MGRIINSIFISMIAVLLIADAGFCLKDGNLYNTFRKKNVVKVFLPDITNLSDSKDVNIDDLKEKLKDILDNRESINFEVTENNEEADIIIDCDVTKYHWKADDPIDMIVGTAAIAYDALTSENYAYMEAMLTVSDVKTKKQLWEKRLKIDLTRKNMSMEESLPLINERAVKIFMRDCFSKGRSNRR
ncbi:MAG: hypothetical protein ABH843_00850 [Candidatus Omnitrophota bacterium]